MQRMGMVVGIRPEKVAEYKALHAAVWPQVLARIAASNIRNYSIFLREPENLLFGCWEYHGHDFEADLPAARLDRAAIRAVFSLTLREPAGVRPAGDSLSLLVQRKPRVPAGTTHGP